MYVKHAENSGGSPATAFKSHSLKTGEQPAKVEPHSFKEKTGIQESNRQYYAYIPQRISREMGFKNGSQVKLRLEEGHITVELMKEPLYISRIWNTGEFLWTTIKSDLVKRMGAEEGDWRLPDAASMNVIGKKSFVMRLSPETIKRNNFKTGDQVEQVIHGRELTLKPVPDGEDFCLTKLEEICDPYPHSTRVSILQEIRNKLDKEKWKKWSTVGFEINEQGRLAIIPQGTSENTAKEWGRYAISNKKEFKYTLAGLTRSDERGAFGKIMQRMEDDGYITGREMKEIFIKHAPAHMVNDFSISLDQRFQILRSRFLHNGGLKKLE